MVASCSLANCANSSDVTIIDCGGAVSSVVVFIAIVPVVVSCFAVVGVCVWWPVEWLLHGGGCDVILVIQIEI